MERTSRCSGKSTSGVPEKVSVGPELLDQIDQLVQGVGQGQLGHDGFPPLRHQLLPGGKSAVGSPILSTGDNRPAKVIVAQRYARSNGGDVAAVNADGVVHVGGSGMC